MLRKEFLMTGGLMVTAAMIATLTAESAEHPNARGNFGPRRPDPNTFSEPVLKVITLALNAPNPHNTQAWKFRIIDDKQVLFYVDEARLLPATDPLARQIHVGCGCFIGLFRVVARTQGYDAKVDYFPEGTSHPERPGEKPLAKLSLVRTEALEDPLSRQIYRRQTNRLQYKGSISRMEFDSLVDQTRPAASSIDLIRDSQKLKPILQILYEAMRVECYDWTAYEESRKWFRVKNDIASKRDGINLRTNGVTGLKLWIAEMALRNYSKKTWHSTENIDRYLDTHRNVVMSTTGIVTFTTTQNTLMDWLRCGEDYVRFQLAATEKGFVIHPLSQALQEFPSMKRLHDQFNELMNVQHPGKIQMVVRIGKAGNTAYSYRKNTTDFIV